MDIVKRAGEPARVGAGGAYLREALTAHRVEADHVKIRQTVGKLRRRHGLAISGEPRGAGLPDPELDLGGEEGEEYDLDPCPPHHVSHHDRKEGQRGPYEHALEHF